MSTRERISHILATTFKPARLEVIDESDQHRGHAGVHPNRVETHFRVRIDSTAFAGISRVEIHRRINAALADELAGGVHALAIEAKSVAVD